MSTANPTPQDPSPSLAEPDDRSAVNTVAAQDVRRRGIRIIVEKLEVGPVHVLQHNRPAFIALREEHYQALVEEIDGARLRASLADVKAGRVKFGSPSELMEEFLG